MKQDSALVLLDGTLESALLVQFAKLKYKHITAMSTFHARSNPYDIGRNADVVERLHVEAHRIIPLDFTFLRQENERSTPCVTPIFLAYAVAYAFDRGIATLFTPRVVDEVSQQFIRALNTSATCFARVESPLLLLTEEELKKFATTFSVSVTDLFETKPSLIKRSA